MRNANFTTAETLCWQHSRVGTKKSPARLWSAGLYKGWVSKHNPYTILKRNFSSEKLFVVFFGRHKKMLTSYPQYPQALLSSRKIRHEYYYILRAGHSCIERKCTHCDHHISNCNRCDKICVWCVLRNETLHYQSCCILTGAPFSFFILSCSFFSSCCSAFSN